MLYPVHHELARHGVLPVVTIDNPEHADPVADALVAGGLPLVEVTFRTPAAEGVMRRLARRGDLLVCAGTVISIDLVKTAVDAGARLMVSPSMNPKVVSYCVDHNIPINPGTMTASEIDQARELGLTVVKWFPAEPAGGLKLLKVIAGPLYMMKFVPSGGITESLLADYLSWEANLGVGGTWIATREMINEKQFDAIRESARRAAEIVRRVRSGK